ncbi:MAG: DUF3108 domain-containing protein [Cyclobacteriaceae bacterium]
MRSTFTVILLFIGLNARGQCEPQLETFKIGEELQYDVYYNWGIIWLHAGEVFFKVQKSEYNEQPAFHFLSVGRSFQSYDWIYKVRDTFQTYVDRQKFRPLYFSRNTYEGGYEVNNEYQFNYETDKIISNTYNSKSGKNKDFIQLRPCTFDVLSIIYYARTLKFDNYQPNEKIPIIVIIDGEIHDLYIRYLGHEKIKSKDGKKYNCIKFSPLLVEGTIFSGGEEMTVWVTDDANRVPILVEAKILVGSIKTYLRDTKNLIDPPLNN